MREDLKPLFTPYKIKNMEMKNRFFMPPMALICECDEHGAYSETTIEYYAKRAQGGTGLLITGANWVDNIVEPHGVCTFPTPNDMPNRWLRKAKELCDRVHAFDTKIVLQLTAGLGRSALPSIVKSEDYVAPSPTINRWEDKPCRELTTEEVEKIVEEFGQAAELALMAGFDGIEVHAVHEGYLMDCFTMAFFNQRTDKYGGDLKGRMTFPIEVLNRIREKTGDDYPVGLRYSVKSYIKDYRKGILPGEDCEEKGRDLEESLEAAKILQEAGYDWFDADAGSYDAWYWAHPPMYFKKGVYLELCRELKKVSTIPLLVCGRMDDPDIMVKAFQEGLLDMVGLGRPLLADPEYTNKLRAGREKDIRPCLGCQDGCFGRLLRHGIVSCAVNPECGRETYVSIRKADTAKRVVIVGGGPAGLEAARVSALRGHSVTLIEAASKLGGALCAGSVPDFKVDDRRLIAYYENQMHEQGVDVRLNTLADKALIDSLSPEVLLLAEGSTPIVPKLPGIEKAVLAQDILLGKADAGNRVVVVGGGLVGCELALYLARQGKKVSIVEGLEDILSTGSEMAPPNEAMLRELLAFHQVDIRTGCRLAEVTDTGLTVTTAKGPEAMEADQTILAIGYKAKSPLFDELQFEYPLVYRLGDSRQVSNILHAVWDGYEVARNL